MDSRIDDSAVKRLSARPCPTPSLAELHADIDRRVRSIRADHPDWLCGKGCDRCCRQLAELPRLTAAEWDLLRAALVALPPPQLQRIADAIAASGPAPARPVVCPLLDLSSGACPVYAARPVACRSYGFYVQRELGLYCREIETRVADGALAEVVWGNHDGIDRRLAALGQARSLHAWFAAWRSDRRREWDNADPPI